MRLVKCLKCGHEWQTKSKLHFVTCNGCMNKVRVETKIGVGKYDKVESRK